MGMRTDRTEFSPIECFQTLDTAEPLAIPLGSVLIKHRVAVAPGEGFGPSGKGYIRLSLAVSDETLELGLERLARAFS